MKWRDLRDLVDFTNWFLSLNIIRCHWFRTFWLLDYTLFPFHCVTSYTVIPFDFVSRNRISEFEVYVRLIRLLEHEIRSHRISRVISCILWFFFLPRAFTLFLVEFGSKIWNIQIFRHQRARVVTMFYFFFLNNHKINI